jgi:alpha-1,3-rhamnosyl/mannosyltransferase
MVVVYNALSIRPGITDGGATFTLNLLRHLPAACPDVEFVVLARGREDRLAPADNLRIERVRIDSAAARVGWERRRLRRTLEALRADVFVSPNESAPPVACPTVVVAQNLAYHCPNAASAFRGMAAADRVRLQLRVRYYRATMRRAYERAAAVVAVSNETARVLGAAGALDLRRAHVVYEGSNSYLLPTPSLEGARQRRLLVVSTLAPYKNVDVAVKAVAHLRSGGHDVSLDVVGGDWFGYRRVLEAHVRRLRLEDAVRFLGNADAAALAEAYSRSLLLLHLSSCESFGLAALDAMRFGLPVVAGAASSVPEVTGGAAVLVDPRDSNAVADAAAVLLADDQARQRLIALGRERAAQLTWSETASAFADVLRSATSPNDVS